MYYITNNTDITIKMIITYNQTYLSGQQCEWITTIQWGRVFTYPYHTEQSHVLYDACETYDETKFHSSATNDESFLLLHNSLSNINDHPPRSVWNLASSEACFVLLQTPDDTLCSVKNNGVNLWVFFWTSCTSHQFGLSQWLVTVVCDLELGVFTHSTLPL